MARPGGGGFRCWRVVAVEADGRPVLTRSHDRHAVIELPGPGFVTLSVIDAKGRAARTTVQLD